jgi:hypothetical protein
MKLVILAVSIAVYSSKICNTRDINNNNDENERNNKILIDNFDNTPPIMRYIEKFNLEGPINKLIQFFDPDDDGETFNYLFGPSEDKFTRC